MSINNREDVNKYYQIINNLVDNYTEQHKIRPSNLKKYLKPGGGKFNKFLERNKLNSIKGCDRILKDIIEDRNSMEKDGVLTFESYKIFESDDFKIPSIKECLYKGIDKSTTKMEKILADYFDTNLSDIDIEDSSKHKFKINEWENDDISVIMYSEEDMDIIKENITDHLLDELKDKEIQLTSDIKIKISEIMDKSSFETSMKLKLTDNLLIKLIEDLTDHKYKGSSDSHYIWVM